MTGTIAKKAAMKDMRLANASELALVEAKKVSRYQTFKRLVAFAHEDLLRITLGLVALGVNSITNLSFPWILGMALDNIQAGAGNFQFLLSSIAFFGVGSVASWVRVYCLGTATDSIANKLRNALFNSFMDKNIDFFQSNKNGELITILDKDVQETSEILTEKLASGLRSLNSSVNGSALLYITSPKLCAVSLSVVPFVGVGAMMLSKYSRLLTEKLRGINSNSASYALERFNSFSTIRLNNRQQYEKGKFSTFAKDVQTVSSKRHFAYGSFMSFINMATNVSMIAVLRVGGDMIAKQQITAGVLSRFAIQSGFVGLGFSGLSTFYSDFKRGLDAAARVFAILDDETDGTVDETSPTVSAPPTPLVTTVPFQMKHATDNSIEFRNVSFVYRSRPDTFVLTNFNVEILANRITVFVGKSGCGKTTILSLLSGLFQPTGGSIRYCDKVIAQAKHLVGTTSSTVAASASNSTSAFSPVSNADGSSVGLATPSACAVEEGWCFNNVGVVEQSSSPLLSGTIAENIEYGKMGASQEEIERAAKAASAHEFITSLPQGYQTEVGVGGCLLSGGQRARIAIARALVKDPVVLLLDEATAALDPENEAEIAGILQRLSVTKTIIVVTHSEIIKKIGHVVYTIEKGGVIVKN